MMKTMLKATVATLLLAPTLAASQAQQQPAQQRQAAQAQPQVAQRCLNDLQTFRQQMRQEGLWLSGYRTGYGWPADSAASRYGQTTARTAPGLGNADERSGSEARARAAGVQAQGGGALGTTPGPWAGMNWRMPPMQELRALHGAAAVMAQRGEEQHCQSVLAELREAYGQYGEQLHQAGFDGTSMGTYRQRRIANARPVGQHAGVLRADNITGTDVRSPRDTYLGSIEDVILDPESGRIAYAIVAHGGFLGVGENYVAVPWQRMRATPDLDLFVLDTTEDAIAGAPTVNPNAFTIPGSYGQRRQEIDSYWQRQREG